MGRETQLTYARGELTHNLKSSVAAGQQGAGRESESLGEGAGEG